MNDDTKMTMKEVLAYVGLSRPHVDRLRRDKKFPDSFGYTDSSRGKVFFWHSAIIQWMQSRTKRNLKPLPPAP
jgi:predicted DNA-binding transcriptional regulator AlpA